MCVCLNPQSAHLAVSQKGRGHVLEGARNFHPQYGLSFPLSAYHYSTFWDLAGVVSPTYS